MNFIYHAHASEPNIALRGEGFHHIFGVRRQKARIDEVFKFANLRDDKIHFYALQNINKKEAIFAHISSQRTPICEENGAHIILGIIDMNEFSKILPMLNELNVARVSLFYADFSQKNQKINMERIKNILINSCMQCARFNLMEIEVFENLNAVLEKYKNIAALDFGGERENIANYDGIIIGPEGGFSAKERDIFEAQKIPRIALKGALILRASTACVAAASAKLEM